MFSIHDPKKETLGGDITSGERGFCSRLLVLVALEQVLTELVAKSLVSFEDINVYSCTLSGAKSKEVFYINSSKTTGTKGPF